jgi:hypothetical protein
VLLIFSYCLGKARLSLGLETSTVEFEVKQDISTQRPQVTKGVRL